MSGEDENNARVTTKSTQTTASTITYQIVLPPFPSDVARKSNQVPQLLSVNFTAYDPQNPSSGPQIDITMGIPGEQVPQTHNEPVALNATVEEKSRSTPASLRVESATSTQPDSGKSNSSLSDRNDASSPSDPPSETESDASSLQSKETPKGTTKTTTKVAAEKTLGNTGQTVEKSHEAAAKAKTTVRRQLETTKDSERKEKSTPSTASKPAEPKKPIERPSKTPSNWPIPPAVKPLHPNTSSLATKINPVGRRGPGLSSTQSPSSIKQTRSIGKRTNTSGSQPGNPRKKHSAGPEGKANASENITIEEADDCVDLLAMTGTHAPQNPPLEVYVPANSIPWRTLFGDECLAKKELRPHHSTVLGPREAIGRKIGFSAENLPVYQAEPQKTSNKSAFSAAEDKMLQHWIIQGKTLKEVIAKYKSHRSTLAISTRIMELRHQMKYVKTIEDGSYDPNTKASTKPIPKIDIDNFEKALRNAVQVS